MPHFNVDGCRINYVVEGPEKGPALVMSNSLGTTLDMWAPQMEALTAQFRVVRYDKRGHGKSDAPAGPYTIDRLGRDAVALFDHLKLESVSFCGLSLGGMTGMWLGINAPSRVSKLLLCNTAADTGDPAPWNTRIETVRRSGMAAVTEIVLERWFTAGFRASAPDAVNRVRQMLLGTPVEGYIGCCAAVRDLDLRAGLGKIRAPTHVIVGKHDPATPAAKGEEIAAAVSGAQLTALDAAHLSNVEQSAAFTKTMLQFLG